MFYRCNYGGNCIDPGNPSDCEVNSRCVNFASMEEKSAFDCLPDLFVVKSQELEIKFKNINQLKFFLADYKSHCGVYAIANDQPIPVDLKELFKHTVDSSNHQPNQTSL